VRQIEPKLVKYIDAKLAGNGLAQDAFERKDARQVFVLAAQACVGIKEKSGRNDGEMVELIQETVGGASGEPWCMALIMSCLAYAEVKCGVKSPLMATEHCQTLWQKTPKSQRVKLAPLAGAIAIWGDVGKSSGHTEIVLSADAKSFQAIGGNTSGTTKPGQAVNRDGNGVFYTVRSMKSTAKRKLLGFLKPF
jgi:hypothetical protein